MSEAVTHAFGRDVGEEEDGARPGPARPAGCDCLGRPPSLSWSLLSRWLPLCLASGAPSVASRRGVRVSTHPMRRPTPPVRAPRPLPVSRAPSPSPASFPPPPQRPPAATRRSPPPRYANASRIRAHPPLPSPRLAYHNRQAVRPGPARAPDSDRRRKGSRIECTYYVTRAWEVGRPSAVTQG